VDYDFAHRADEMVDVLQILPSTTKIKRMTITRPRPPPP
jgi:hypothetical protein